MKFPENLAAFVINLDHSVDRLQAIECSAKKIDLRITRVPAIYGKSINITAEPTIDAKGYALFHGKEISLNEVGCYLSHLKALKCFLDSDAEFAIILEDDANFPSDYPQIIIRLLELAHAWDIVKLSSFHSGTPVAIERINARLSLSIPFSRHMNANNVLYNREAAKRMVKVLNPMRLPFDHALERAWLFGLRLRVVSPAPCLADSGFSSTISDQCNYRFVWYKRLPCLGFRLITELSRFIFASAHFLRYQFLKITSRSKKISAPEL
jgi:glycosyl transferase family 25